VLTQLHNSLVALLPVDESWLLTDYAGPVSSAPAIVDGPPPGLAIAPALRGWMVVPLSTPERAIGAVVLAARAPEAFRESHLGLAAALVAHGMTAYQNAVLFRRVAELATVDSLTGVASRRHFFERGIAMVGAARLNDERLAAIMVDIDHFKPVNDTYGHATGDQVIAEVAARLATALAPGDLMGRYGGEEFAVVLGPADAHRAPVVGERLRAAIATCAVDTESGPLPVTVSVGIAMLGDAADLAAVLARADEALYRAKHTGRNRVCV
jgi:diguanylate cyclase (GGDEF)-like protein